METIVSHRRGHMVGRALAVLLAIASAGAVAFLAQRSDLERILTSHRTVLSFLFATSLILIFLLGYGIRDGLQKRGQRARAALEPDGIPRRP